MKIRRTGFVLCLLAAVAGCQSNIRPLRPLERSEVVVPDQAATTGPATQTASTEPATQPGHTIVKVVDPNQTARFIYQASYDNIWQQAMTLFSQTGFEFNVLDYRLGTIESKPLLSAQIVEFWKPQHANVKDSIENTFHNQRRTARLTISKVPGKPDFYELAIRVIVERETNPTEQLAGPMFVEGSGFGRNRLALQSDYATPAKESQRWVIIGHDPDLETKLLDQLFLHL